MADLITYSPLILVLRIWEIVESSHSLLCLFRNVLLKQDINHQILQCCATKKLFWQHHQFAKLYIFEELRYL
ncbi:hypothetical protein CISIN_1g038737mg [Citrus sinensis]|uniref:Uncharacterized protein n=1 Tax=Citrus sinensis TaxID=2711 RepID=A0A067DBG5_CITSI|nr:hypothetical protein CISIN_1g038737mg [Citrus sinensis]